MGSLSEYMAGLCLQGYTLKMRAGAWSKVKTMVISMRYCCDYSYYISRSIDVSDGVKDHVILSVLIDMKEKLDAKMKEGN